MTFIFFRIIGDAAGAVGDGESVGSRYDWPDGKFPDYVPEFIG